MRKNNDDDDDEKQLHRHFPEINGPGGKNREIDETSCEGGKLLSVVEQQQQQKQQPV